MNPVAPQLRVEDGVIHLQGQWTAPLLNSLERRLLPSRLPSTQPLVIDLTGVERMDTAGAWVVRRMLADCEASGRTASTRGANAPVAAMLELVASHPDPRSTPAARRRPGTLETVGRESIATLRIGYEFLSFLGEGALTTLWAFSAPRRLRPRMVLRTIEQAGVNALPIIGLLSFLIGVVIGYQSAVFLRQYGANVFLADLVGISMARELAPLMTAIIVAGRTGSAFTAQIGTMMVTEEVDAIRAMGIRPLEVLVAPKMLGLIVALPLLTLFADLMGVLGGMVIGRAVLDISPVAFMDRLVQAVSVSSYLVGLAKAPIFAMVIAAVGCYQGFKVRGSAESVGRRTTVSVVQSIFMVIVLDAVFSVLFNWLGI